MIYSIGYQKLDQKRLIEILKAHRAEVLVDVRSRPYGRITVFNRNAMEHWLPASGIVYLWKGDILGVSRLSRKRLSSGWLISAASGLSASCSWRLILRNATEGQKSGGVLKLMGSAWRIYLFPPNFNAKDLHFS